MNIHTFSNMILNKDLCLNNHTRILIMVYLIMNMTSITFSNLALPVVQLYMASHVSQNFFTASFMIELIIGLVINMASSRKFINALYKYMSIVAIVNCIIMIMVNLIVSDDANTRYIIIAICNPLIDAVTYKIIGDAFNNVCSGTNLTILNERSEGVYKVGMLLGFIISFFVTMDIITALVIQMIGIIIDTIACLTVVKALLKISKRNKEKEEE